MFSSSCHQLFTSTSSSCYRVRFTLAFLSLWRVVVARGDAGYLDTTELTAELPVSDLSPWSNQIRMTVMLSQEFFPYLHQ